MRTTLFKLNIKLKKNNFQKNETPNTNIGMKNHNFHKIRSLIFNVIFL